MSQRRKAVIVEWEDITSTQGWKDLETAMAVEIVTVRSMGWILEDSDKYLRIAATISQAEIFNDISLIPKGCILSIKGCRG